MSTPPVKLSFGGLKKPIISNNSNLLNNKNKINSKPAFSFTDPEEDDLPSNPTASTSKLKTNSTSTSSINNTQPKVSTSTLSRQQKLKQAEDLKLDSSVYEYDEVYDNMKEGGRLAELEKKKDSGERKPKYIEKLMETAEVRKRDRVRAEDKMVQREREKEGAEFADKDEFVTPAYKLQQEELRKIEAEESKKEAAGGKSLGMSSFYKTYLDTNSAAHDAAVAASLIKTPDSQFKISAPKAVQKSEAQQAAEFTALTGKKLEVNDDGIIIDKREMLSGGLNIVKKPKLGPHLPSEAGGGGFSAPIAAREASKDSSSSAGLAGLPVGLSAAERNKQSRERYSRDIERQMAELEKKRKRDEETEANELKLNKIVKRNDETRIEELKRKAEERRLKREEDAKNAVVE